MPFEHKSLPKQERRKPVEIKNLETEPLLPIPELQDDLIEDYIHEHGIEVGFEGSRNRVIEILKIVREDEVATEMINETLKSIFRYVESIYILETQARILEFRFEGDEYKERVSGHDSRRRRAHDALIANLISCTRYLNEHFFSAQPSTGIYNGDPQHLIEQNRLAIADWAIELEHEILLGRER
ncbi:MAG: DUF3232 domain-containing protein [Patescibacteria group bacterium]